MPSLIGTLPRALKGLVKPAPACYFPRMDPVHQVTLQSLAAGGEAVGRLEDGLVTFVAGGAPGDVVEVELEERRRGYARGRLLRVLQPGPGRVEPACALAATGECGGCPWMHLARPVQLAAKEDLVRRALRHTAAQVLPILTPATPLAYRIRARFTQHGQVLGFQAARSHQVTRVTACPVLVPPLESALCGVAARLAGQLGEGGTLAGLAGTGGEVHLAATSGRGGDLERARAVVRETVATGTLSGASLDGWSAGVQEVDCGGAQSPLWISADSFAQASAPGHEILPALVEAAVSSAPGGGRWPKLLELYAGSGNLTRALRRRAAAVLAVEADHRAATRLAGLGLDNVQVRAEPAERVVASLAAKGQRFDVAVLDPPRTGAKEVLSSLVRLGPRRIVYVSCDPITLGRDLEALGRLGFPASYAQPVDLAPQTAHVEIVAVAGPAA